MIRSLTSEEKIKINEAAQWMVDNTKEGGGLVFRDFANSLTDIFELGFDAKVFTDPSQNEDNETKCGHPGCKNACYCSCHDDCCNCNY